MVDICEVLEHLIEEFEKIDGKNFKLKYKKVIVPADTTENNMTEVWSSLHWPVDWSTSYPDFCPTWQLYEHEEDTEPSFIVHFALSGENVTNGWHILKTPIKDAIELLRLRRYDPDSIPDSGTFLDNFPRSKKEATDDFHTNIWCEFLLKLSQEDDCPILNKSIKPVPFQELPCKVNVEGLKTDVLTASKLVLKYLLKKAMSAELMDPKKLKKSLISLQKANLEKNSDKIAEAKRAVEVAIGDFKNLVDFVEEYDDKYFRRGRARVCVENIRLTYKQHGKGFGGLWNDLANSEFISDLKAIVDAGTRDPDGCVAQHEYKWQKVQKKVGEHWKSLKEEGKSFPSIRSFARKLGENAGTVKKAILYSRSLTQAYNKGKPKSKKIKFIDSSKLDYVGPKAFRKGGKPDPEYEEGKDNLLKQIKQAARKEANDFDPDVKAYGSLVLRNIKGISKLPNEGLKDLLADLTEKHTNRMDKIKALFERDRLR